MIQPASEVCSVFIHHRSKIVIVSYAFLLNSRVFILKAAQDACDLMGHRKFYDQVLEDIIHYDTYKITDQIDVTTLKDYMQVNLEKKIKTCSK